MSDIKSLCFRVGIIVSCLLLPVCGYADKDNRFDRYQQYEKNFASKVKDRNFRHHKHRGHQHWPWPPASNNDWIAPQYSDVTVHDPSVIRVDGTYYVFGSHLAAAKSDDLVQWQQVAEGVDENNPLFENVVEELSETLAWAEADTLWAADVIQLKDGKFYYYYNACRGDSPLSAMGVAVADNVEGPYVNKGIFLRSGMWGQPSEDGLVYDARVHPNVVDPDTFYDASGKLWMIYGSYSGGLFIMKMDPKTGMPYPGQGYGKHLMGGNHSRIEGAYVLYSPETRYYYMFTSFGGLTADGGYNIRVARSRRPDGPYYDAAGNNMAAVKSDPSLPLFDDANVEPFGQKLMGSHLFERKLGEPGEGIGSGYVSPGHNSAYYDERTGRYFMIFHARFPERGEFHQVRVHEMFINSHGWPVVAPHRYAPRVTSNNSRDRKYSDNWWDENLDFSQVIGNYKFINHGKAISSTVITSDLISLESNGRISGALNGRWYLSGFNNISLLIDGIRYSGVLSYQWHETAQKFVMTFTAQSNEGISVWGSKLEYKPARQVVNDVLADISLGGAEPITGDLVLPTEGTHGAVIEWVSYAPEIISAQGKVSRPENGEGDRTVTLKADVHYKRLSKSKTFEVVVKEKAPAGLVAHYAFDQDLLDNSGQQQAAAVSGPLIDAAGGNISFVEGVANSAALFDGASGIRLPNGLINSATYSVSFWLNPSVITPFSTAFFGARSGNSWVSFLPKGHGFVNEETMLWSGSAWYDAGTGLNISENTWSHIAFTVDKGALSVYVDGDLRFAGLNFPDVFTNANAVLSLGVNWWDVPYQGSMDELRIYERALSSEEVLMLSSNP